jgi:ADP-heptose:LPS heptosyltransferase
MILALRALGLGDLLTAVPALRALRRAHRTEEIALAAPQPLRPLVSMGGLADELIAVDPAVGQPPKPISPPAQPVAIAVNLHGEGPQSTDVLRRLHPAVLWSFGVAGAPLWDPQEHEVRRWCRLVEHYGCPADPTDLALRPRSDSGEGVLIHPGAATVDRRWPAARYAIVAARLADAGHRVRITAGPGEEKLAALVAGLTRRPAVTTVGGLDLAALADLVAASALVLCGDTGIAHLATALQTPSVVLFGSQKPSRWGPPRLARHQVLWRPVADPVASDQPHPGLLRLQVDDVLSAAELALAAARVEEPATVHPYR